jgi:hypothetical protein
MQRIRNSPHHKKIILTSLSLPTSFIMFNTVIPDELLALITSEELKWNRFLVKNILGCTFYLLFPLGEKQKRTFTEMDKITREDKAACR